MNTIDLKRVKSDRLKVGLLLCCTTLLVLLYGCGAGKKVSRDSARPESSLGWKLGAQAYTFREFTFSEALDKLRSAGLDYVEAYTRQEIGGGIPGTMHYSMDAETRERVKALLREKGVELAAYGVVKAKDAKDWRAVFEFCKEMGVRVITCEPAEKHLSVVSALCDEYGIDAAIHNHPKPSAYWDPESVLRALEGRSKRLGACADLGHWVRSGLDPVESLRKLSGHLKHLHFKDLNELGNRKAHDVIWGTGVCRIPEVIAELKRQRFKGMLAAEYEYNWSDNVGEVRASVNYFRLQLQRGE